MTIDRAIKREQAKAEEYRAMSSEGNAEIAEINIRLGVSPITDTIYYGTVKNNMWQGKREDVTDMAIGAVFEWFMHKLDNEQRENPDVETYQIRYPSLPYVLEMRKEDKGDNANE